MPDINGTNGNDQITGTNDGDIIIGNRGDDTISGLDGNDVIYGGGIVRELDPNGVTVSEATTARVELESIAKGFHNAVGMYKVGANGSIYDVSIIYAPDGGKGGGQGLELHTVLDVPVAAGEQLGFFVLGNGYGKGNIIDALNDPSVKFELRTKDGDPGLIVDTNLQLWMVDPLTGSGEPLTKGSGQEILHSLGTAEGGYAPNPDGVQHAVAIVDTTTGTVKIGLEAQKNGGNLSFDDAIISIELGQSNVTGLEGATSPLESSDDDDINGGAGNDTIFGQGGNDRLDGGIGDDRLSGGTGDDRIFGGDGADFIQGNSGNDVIEGGEGNDEVTGGKGDDAVAGDGGNDVLKGDTGDDTVDGGGGDDAIKGGEDNDVVTGGAGNDNLSGGKGADNLDGGFGNDVVFGDSGDDIVRGGQDDDTVKGGEGNDFVYGDAGNDVITGGKGNDVLNGGHGDDIVEGNSGDDLIIASHGSDNYDGGSGIDTIDYSAAGTTVNVDLETHSASSDLGSDVIWSIENVIGSAQADTLVGDKRDNELQAAGGGDFLRGGRGDDLLEGGEGTDTYSWALKDVIGTSGLDAFVDTIIGFNGDVLDLSALVSLVADESASDVVAFSEAGGNTAVSVYSATQAAWIDVVVLDDVTGLDISGMETAGQVIV